MNTWNHSVSFALIIYSLSAGSLVCADTQDTIQERLDEERSIATAMAKRGNKGEWVVVPIPVSNPTIGTGLQGALLYLHPRKEGDGSSPNATSGIGAMYTDTGSWAVGGFHDDSWKNDQYRFKGLIGYGEIAMKYYGGGNIPILPKPLGYDLNILVAMPQIQMRLPGSMNWYAGVNYLYVNSENIFHLEETTPILPDVKQRIVSAGLGFLITYDNRNDNYYPTQGVYFQATTTNFSKRWGGDNDYHKSKVRVSNYRPIGKRTILALSTRIDSSSEDTPFSTSPILTCVGLVKASTRTLTPYPCMLRSVISFGHAGGLSVLPRRVGMTTA